MQTRLLTTIQDVAEPGHSALIIVDPQHDFCSEKGAMAQRFGFDMKEIREAVPKLNALIEACRAAGVMVVWVREVFSDDKMHPNQKALWGSGDDIWLIREDGDGIAWYDGMIAPAPGERVITKWQYDAFADTELHLLLQSRGIKTLLMAGFTTNVCVETTARHGYIKGYHIVLASDCAGAPTRAEHEAGVFNIKTYFGHVATGADLAAIWSRSSSAVRARS
ncbi:isochorismatase family protein [Bradyrhizobium pachyrhizi]|uniref:Isochorismatase family protein n=1 Tax=Bradyrhizobium pachyrhizi TaxID=280333 RepID=A0A844SG14_9BRAD|nr:cysteine hydrolase [Bradyrhizobium pachyrhizi]MVT64495.1 isochorismatase family protein [Bradyrhizobium pachyrhizi]